MLSGLNSTRIPQVAPYCHVLNLTSLCDKEIFRSPYRKGGERAVCLSSPPAMPPELAITPLDKMQVKTTLRKTASEGENLKRLLIEELLED